MKLKELYSELTKNPNSPESFIANVIYTNCKSRRKKMLQGLYNIVNGGPKHFWSKNVRFASFNMKTILAARESILDAMAIEIDKENRKERVYSHARVYGNAKVYGNARVFGDARVC